MPPCVCGHVHTDSCPCGCSYAEEDLGRDETVSGPTYARWVAYEGFYNRHYTLDQETA